MLIGTSGPNYGSRTYKIKEDGNTGDVLEEDFKSLNLVKVAGRGPERLTFIYVRTDGLFSVLWRKD